VVDVDAEGDALMTAGNSSYAHIDLDELERQLAAINTTDLGIAGFHASADILDEIPALIQRVREAAARELTREGEFSDLERRLREAEADKAELKAWADVAVDDLKARLHEAETETQRLLNRLSGGMRLAHQAKTRRLKARITQLERVREAAGPFAHLTGEAGESWHVANLRAALAALDEK
jgi:hypothetical protein